MINIKDHILYLGWWLVTSIVLYIISTVSSGNVVLGTFKYTIGEAAVYAGFWATFLVWLFWDFAQARGWNLKGTFQTFVFFWILNIAAIWLVARFAPITGVGITSYVWAIIVAFVVDLAQTAVWTSFSRSSLSK